MPSARRVPTTAPVATPSKAMGGRMTSSTESTGVAAAKTLRMAAAEHPARMTPTEALRVTTAAEPVESP
jgi:hypothetical protein